MNCGTRRAVLALLAALVPALASAGPPLLCFPVETGGAPSLPWGGSGWNEPRADYARTRLADDTVALLAPGAPVLARMETLRRAVLYARGDAAAAKQLTDALRARAGAGDATRALARFDLGYALEAMRQARNLPAPAAAARAAAFGTGTRDDDGYALVQEALAARGEDPEMEYAAALIATSRASREGADVHLRRALAGAAAGSPLARTIAAHRPLWGGRLRAYQASTR